MCECSPMSSGFTTDEIPCPQPLWWLRVVWSAKDLTPENLVLHSWHTFSLEHCIQLTLYRLINQRYLTLNRLTNNHLRMSSSTYPLSQKIWGIGTITIYRIFRNIVWVIFSCSYCTPSRSIIIFSQPPAYPPKGVNANPVLTYGRNRKIHDIW